jgi:hypothetical protein
VLLGGRLLGDEQATLARGTAAHTVLAACRIMIVSDSCPSQSQLYTVYKTPLPSIPPTPPTHVTSCHFMLCHDLTSHAHRRQPSRAHKRQPNDHPAGLVDVLVLQSPREIPHQVPDPVRAVEREGHGGEELERQLGRERQAAERRRHRARLQVPAEQWCNEVAEAEDVEGTAERAPRDAVHRRQVPGHLRLVDGEVGRDGTRQALLDEQLVAVVLVDVLGGGGASVGGLLAAVDRFVCVCV